MAQQTTGTPGTPGATTTIDGRYLPAPSQPFGGIINMTAPESKPFWPATIVPPKGAPNILLIMTDDQGYGVSGTFGGVVPTPAMDALAKSGLRYTQFHSTALCSPTRAALITGRNHHSVGFGVIGEFVAQRIQKDDGHKNRHRMRRIGFQFTDHHAPQNSCCASASGRTFGQITVSCAGCEAKASGVQCDLRFGSGSSSH